MLTASAALDLLASAAVGPFGPSSGEAVALTTADSLQLAGLALAAAVAALALSVVVHAVVARLGRRSDLARALAARAKRPFRWLLVLVSAQQVLGASSGTNGWLAIAQRAAEIAVIAGAGWLLVAVAFVAEDLVLARYRVDVEDNRHARRVRTQTTFLRRIAVAVVAVLVLAAALWTFPSARGVGTGIFASAGLLSVVAGLAAQSSLANVFAGLQLAFTDALRVDDVVVVEQEWGRIEEITLTYVVVHVWDDRRLVLPSTWFTSTPFENWTRRDSQLLGAVLLDVDWSTDLDALRAEMHRVLDGDELWDGRVAVLQVVDAVGGRVQVRVLVSAKDGPTVFDLRCHVREALVRWLVASDPDGLPRTRITADGAAPAPAAPRGDAPPARTAPRPSAAPSPSRPRGPVTAPTAVLPPAGARDASRDGSRDDSLFTGSLDALQRSRQFAGPTEAEQADRVEKLLREERERVADEERDAARQQERVETETSVLPAVPERR